MVKNDFRILVVNHTNVHDMTEKNWPLEKVCLVELPNNDIWNANNNYWKKIFEGIFLV